MEAPTVPFLAEGNNTQGGPVRCTPSYGSDCAETNSLAILGQGLSDLIMGEPLREPAVVCLERLVTARRGDSFERPGIQ